jgi:alkylation response protein AidB-like acyl-CoA dehydrogenase
MNLFYHRLASWELPPTYLHSTLLRLSAVVRQCDEVGLLEARRLNGPSICAVDDPSSSHGLPLGDLCWLMRGLGQIDIEWRDALGMGHARLIRLAETSEQCIEFADNCSTGAAFAAIAITEPDAGSSLTKISTQVTKQGTIVGAKRHVGRITESSAFIVLCSETEAPHHRTFYLVSGDSNSMTKTRVETAGLKKTSWGEVVFHGVPISEDQRVGQIGEAISLFHKHFAHWRTLIASVVVGATETLLQMIIDEMTSRKINGTVLAEYSHWRQELACSTARLRAAWALCLSAAKAHDDGTASAEAAAIAKSEAIEASCQIGDMYVRIRSARSFSEDDAGSLIIRSLQGIRFADGTTEALRNFVASQFLPKSKQQR